MQRSSYTQSQSVSLHSNPPIAIQSSPLPPIHSLSKISLKHTPSLSRLDKKSLKFLNTFSRNPSTYRETHEKSNKLRNLTPKSFENSKIEWKKLEKSRIIEKMREKSLISSLDKSQNFEKSNNPELTQHNISKFYLEYHNNHHPNREKFLSKLELIDLLGLKPLNLNKDDQRITEILSSYPNCEFLDLNTLRISDTDRLNPINTSPLTTKFKKLLMKDSFDPNKFTITLKELEHHSQNNSMRNPNKRQGVFEMAQFLDKISENIVNPQNNDNTSLDNSVFAMQNACRVCIQSLANEIAKECNERGVLLAQVWDLNIQLMNIYVRKIEKFSGDLEAKFQRNLMNIREVYEEKMLNLEEKVKTVHEEKTRCENTAKSLEQDCQFYKEKLTISEKIRKLLENDFEELMINYESVFLDNLRSRLAKFEGSGHRSEKEIIKKGIEEFMKNKKKREQEGRFANAPEQTMQKMEGIYRKMNTGELSKADLKETTGRFMRQMTNLSFNILEVPKRIDDYLGQDYENNEGFKEALGFFAKDACVDTKDLTLYEDKAVCGSDFRYLREKEEEVQTVFIDEIEDLEINGMNNMLESDIFYRERNKTAVVLRNFGGMTPLINTGGSRGFIGSPKKTYSRDLSNSPDNSHSTIRKRVFSFNQETLHSLDQDIDMNSLTVSKVLDFYHSEMQTFYTLLLSISEEITHSSPNHNFDNLNIDWFATQETILNNRGLHEQFIKLLFERDKKRMKEILSQKIEIIQKNLDFEESERNFKKLEAKFAKISRKFDEFFEFILKEEAEKLIADNAIEASEKTLETSLEAPNFKENSYNKPAKNQKKKNKTVIFTQDDSQIDRLQVLKTLREFSVKRSSQISEKPHRKHSFTEEKTIFVDKSFEKKEKLEKFNEFSIKRADFFNETLKEISHNRIIIKIKSPHSNNCQIFLQKSRLFLEKNSDLLIKKNVGSLSISTIIKTISPLLIELLKRIIKTFPNKLPLNPFIFIFYEYMFNRHSLSQENTETRMAKVLQSCIFYKENARIRNYLRLFAMFQNKEFIDGSDLHFYLECLRELDDSFIGTFNKENSFEKINTIPGIPLLLNQRESAQIGLNKALEKITEYFKKSLNVEKYKMKLEDIINKIKAVKEPDPLISRKYVVDVDFIIEFLFWIRDERNRDFHSVFTVVDLENRESIEVNEFALLVKNLEFKEKSLEILELFKQESDLLDDEGRDLVSFKRFVSICEENKWLVKKSLEKIMRKSRDEIKNFEVLKKEWDVKKNLIKLRFIKSGCYNRFYSRVLKRIDDLLLEKKDEEKTWVLYRLIDEESCHIVLKWEVEGLIGKELGDLKAAYEKIVMI